MCEIIQIPLLMSAAISVCSLIRDTNLNSKRAFKLGLRGVRVALEVVVVAGALEVVVDLVREPGLHGHGQDGEHQQPRDQAGGDPRRPRRRHPALSLRDGAARGRGAVCICSWEKLYASFVLVWMDTGGVGALLLSIRPDRGPEAANPLHLSPDATCLASRSAALPKWRTRQGGRRQLWRQKISRQVRIIPRLKICLRRKNKQDYLDGLFEVNSTN